MFLDYMYILRIWSYLLCGAEYHGRQKHDSLLSLDLTHG